MGAFINPFTDWGFKHIFGREVSKDILIEFLNDLLQGERVITDLRFLNNEQPPEQKELRKVIYDIYCETDTGEYIIVEMQNQRQENFKERGLFYQAQAIVRQGMKGKFWNFRLDAVYGVFFANFFLADKTHGRLRRDVALTDLKTGEIFCDKLRQIYIELPYFTKAEAECETDFERWIYVLKNMETLDRLPFKVRKAVFDRLEQLASKANMTPEERWQYEEEWKNLNDIVNTHAYAMKEGREAGLAEGRKEGLAEGRKAGLAEGKIEGKIEGKLEIAKKMMAKGMDPELIMEMTGLSTEEIEKL